MSYILGALRKAEQERKGESETDFDDWNSDDWNTQEKKQGSGQWLWIVLVVVVALLVAILVSLWLLLEQKTNDPELVISEAENYSIDKQIEDLANPEAQQTPQAVSQVVISQNPDAQITPKSPINQVEIDRSAVPADIGEPDLPEITGHLFFPTDESLNKVFLDGGSYKVGDTVSPGLVIVEITNSEAVFEWKRQRQYRVPF